MFARDLERSRDFYRQALAPLGIVVGYEAEGVCELWHEEADTPSLSLHERPDDPTRGLHLAFAARDRAAVDAFFAAALAAGGTEREAPRHWPEYRAYCAFVSDPDGNNIEALHKDP